MKRKKKMTMFEWTTLVGAWRYYEKRATIASATFPADIVEHYWGSGRYDDADLHQIANQFAEIDHGSDGEAYWSEDKTIHDCDRKAWCKFYAFCKAYCNGFSTVVLNGKNMYGDHIHEEPQCFRCEYTGRWYSVADYISNPHLEKWCNQRLIKKIVPGVIG